MKKITDFFKFMWGLVVLTRMMIDRQLIEEIQDEEAYDEGGEESLLELHRRRKKRKGCGMFR